MAADPAPAPRSRRPVAFHPLLVATFPVVSLWSANALETAARDVWPILAGVVAGAAIAFVVASLILRDHRRGALVASGLALLFLSYGHVAGWSVEASPGVATAARWALPALWTGLAAAVVVAALRLRARVAELTTILNGTSLALVAVAALPLVTSGLGGGTGPVPGPSPSLVATRSPERDIWYLVPDRYASEDTLARVFDHDNRPFLDGLERSGFSVADDSCAPYGKTAHSLAASLNLDYLDDLEVALGPDEDDWHPVWDRIKSNEVARFLTANGYRYVHVGSWWSPTSDNADADVTLTYDESSEFSEVFWDTTAVRPLRGVLGGGGAGLRERLRSSVLYQLDQLDRVAAMDGPKFVFAHLTIPHPPYVFDADGSEVTGEQARSRTREENYVAQLEYANLRFRQLFDRLLAGPAERDPIIILQADEGPYPARAETSTAAARRFPWLEATDDELREHLEIINAIHLPGLDDDPVTDTLSPVNTFRIVFDRYFGTELGLLDDRCYVFPSEAHLYDFVDVTDRVRGG